MFAEDGKNLSTEFLAFRTGLLKKDITFLKHLKTNFEIGQHIANIQAERAAAKAAKLKGQAPEQTSALDAALDALDF